MLRVEASPTCEPVLAPPRVECRHLEQPTAVVRVVAPAAQVRASLLSAFSKVRSELARLGESPSGSPFVAIHHLSSEGADLEAGVPVARHLPLEGGVQDGAIPIGRYLMVMEQGDIGSLAKLSQRVAHWLARERETMIGPLYLELRAEGMNPQRLACLLQARIMGGESAPEPDLGEERVSTIPPVLDALKVLRDRGQSH